MPGHGCSHPQRGTQKPLRGTFMSEAKYITNASALMSLPLAELANPEHLTPLSEFVDNLAAPCVAEALMGLVSVCYLLILFDIFRLSFDIFSYDPISYRAMGANIFS
jgi:hypothetical protein